jgi:hypothetical protein
MIVVPIVNTTNTPTGIAPNIRPICITKIGLVFLIIGGIEIPSSACKDKFRNGVPGRTKVEVSTVEVAFTALVIEVFGDSFCYKPS